MAVKLQIHPKKVVIGPPICRGRGYLRFWTCVFKSQLLPTMWPILFEFRSASSEIRQRKKRKKGEERKKESEVKYMSADILRPNQQEVAYYFRETYIKIVLTFKMHY